MMTVLVRAYFPKAAEAVPAGKKHGGKPQVNEGADGMEVTDPTWKMLVPLVIFTVMIVVIGVHSAPLMELLMKIGGEVG